MVKYIIDLNVNLECTACSNGHSKSFWPEEIKNGKWKPIHFICLYQPLDMVQYITSKRVSIKDKVINHDYRILYDGGKDIDDLMKLNPLIANEHNINFNKKIEINNARNSMPDTIMNKNTPI